MLTSIQYKYVDVNYVLFLRFAEALGISNNALGINDEVIRLLLYND